MDFRTGIALQANIWRQDANHRNARKCGCRSVLSAHPVRSNCTQTVHVQRSFSTFPNAWPGAGLLLLRLTLGSALFVDAAAALEGPPLPQMTIPAIAELLAGALIVVGLWTPLAAVFACLLSLGFLLIVERAIEPQLLRAAIGIGLVLLGPGAWSVDARLFGRRRVEIKNLRDD